jgi:hypothetical protein
MGKRFACEEMFRDFRDLRYGGGSRGLTSVTHRAAIASSCSPPLQ